MTWDDWRKTKLEARIWWCEDEVCDCTMPEITRITPNLDVGYPWIRREIIWAGSFRSQRDEQERLEQENELKDKAKFYGIELNEDLFGVKFE